MTEIKKTRVVSCLLSHYDTYIGRGDPRVGTPDSDWANPFVIGVHGDRPTCVAKFKDYLYSRPDLLRRIESLQGRVLGCHCKPGDIDAGMCHGVVLAQLANGELPMPELPEFEGWEEDEGIDCQVPPLALATTTPPLEVVSEAVTLEAEAAAPAVPADNAPGFKISKRGKAVKVRAKKKALKSAPADKFPYPADFEGVEPPKSLWKARRIGNKEYVQKSGKVLKGVLHLPGRGSKTASVMFISPCVLQEEQWSNYSSDPILLKGAPGNLFLRCIRRTGFKDEDWFYTTLCKYNVPRMKLKAEDIRWNQEMLADEIRAIKPKLIICLGKPPFDHLSKLKFKLKDIQGGFFRSEEFDCLLYPMDGLMTPLMKPEFLERFLVDLKEAKRTLDELNGVKINRIALDYQVIETQAQLEVFCQARREAQAAGGLVFMTVDCEWAGQTAWGGLLRSVQFGWKAGAAAYLKLRDEKGNYVFDTDLATVGDTLRPILSHPGTQLVGHNFAADAVWLEEHLDIRTAGRCGFDTMFAQQTINEYADLKLERLSVKYTDLGRYDIELLLWKKANKFDEDDNKGYGEVPDKIIIPYALRDVDATFRIFPILMRQLTQQGLRQYYFDYVLPFVTDVFVELMRTGMPIHREYLDEMRLTFTRNQEILIQEFRKAIKSEANRLLLTALCGIDKKKGPVVFKELLAITKNES